MSLAARRLKEPPLTIMRYEYSEKRFPDEAVNEGANRFIDKSTEFKQVIEAIDLSNNGRNIWRKGIMLKPSRICGIVLVSFCAISLIGAADVNAKWFFGIGTGITFNNHEGTQGVHSDAFGPIQYDFDWDPEEFRDLVESGFGFGGYITNGLWTFSPSVGTLKIQGESTGDLPANVGGGTFELETFFEKTQFQLTVGYTLYRSENKKFSFTPNIGVRSINHEVGSDIIFTQGGTNTVASGSKDFDFTDFLVGASVGYAFSPKISVSAKGGAGLGDAESSSTFGASLTWKPWTWLSLSPNISASNIEFLQGNKGDPDWYIYESDETGGGLSFLFNF